jgi:hypothetical protein
MQGPNFFLFIVSTISVVTQIYFLLRKNKEMKNWPRVILTLFYACLVLFSIIVLWGIVFLIVR